MNPVDQNNMLKDVNSSYELKILSSLRKIIHTIDVYNRKINREYNVTVPQLICLHSLSENGEMSLSMLANRVHLGISTVNTIIDRLEIKGLVDRRRGEQDRRKVRIMITEKGLVLLETAPTLLQDMLSRGLRQLQQPELITVTQSLERIVELLNAEDIDATPHLLTENQFVETKNKG